MPYTQVGPHVFTNPLLEEFSDLLAGLEGAREKINEDDEASLRGDYKADPEADARMAQVQREAVTKLVRFIQARGDDLMADFASGPAWVF